MKYNYNLRNNPSNIYYSHLFNVAKTQCFCFSPNDTIRQPETFLTLSSEGNELRFIDVVY